MATPNSPLNNDRSYAKSPNENLIDADVSTQPNLSNTLSRITPSDFEAEFISGSNQRSKLVCLSGDGRQLRKSIAENVLCRLAQVETQLEESLSI